MRHVDEIARQGTTQPSSSAVHNFQRVLASVLTVAGFAVTASVADLALAKNSSGPRTIQTPFGPAPASFADIAARVKPAVVSIYVTNVGTLAENKDRRRRRGRRGGPSRNLPKGHPLDDFFKRFGRLPNGSIRPPTGIARGSGFVVSPGGHIVTNNHVIKGADRVHVSFDDQKKIAAKVIGTDPRTDLALLKVAGKKSYPYLEFAETRPRVGDWVLAVGNPLGLGETVTAGVVSARERSLPRGVYRFMQIDAAVNKGNSGGPSVNLRGKVVGVNTAIFSPGRRGGNIGIAFAIPASVAANVVQQLKETGRVKRGWLGISMQPMTRDIAISLGLKEPRGALVRRVTPNGPAQSAGVKAGDAIMAVNGIRVEDTRDLARKIGALAPDTVAKLDVLRRGKTKRISVKLGVFPAPKQQVRLQRQVIESFGNIVAELGLTLVAAASHSGANTPGVLIMKVEPGSDAAQKGLKSGDIILQISGDDANQPSDVMKGLTEARKLGRKAVMLQVRSGSRSRLVGLPIRKR